MDEPPSLTPAHFAHRGRQLHPTSDSPARQHDTDDLLSNLTPRTVVDAFRTPLGTLKICIEAATPAEQAFALRVAVASNNIHEWLQELASWPWPPGGSAGFEMAAAKGRIQLRSDAEPAHNEASHLHQGFVGSLPTADISNYETRIDAIGQGLEDLDIDEIKSQVLNNHIMPLSRPGTPILGLGRSVMSSLSAIARMDDLAALVTATTLQALPNLSKLTRLMSAWHFRLLVLRKIPVFLTSIADAEVALQSGWNAISLAPKVDSDGGASDSASGTGSTTLSMGEFDVMRSVLERKVAKTGSDLDAMLDILEGQPDTLPDDWIDRVDALEQGYGEWIAACERKIRETDWARITGETNRERLLQATNGMDSVVEPPAASRSLSLTPTETERPLTPSPPNNETNSQGDRHEIEAMSPVGKPTIKIHPTAEDQPSQPEDGRTENSTEASPDGPDDGHNPTLSVSGPAGLVAGKREENTGSAHSDRSGPDYALSSISEDDVPQTGLLLSRSRRDSGVSDSSTIIHGQHIGLTDSFSSGELVFSTPERPRRREVELQGAPDIEASSFSSFRSNTRSLSVTFSDKPTIAELPSFPTTPTTPAKSSILEDEVSTAPGTPTEVGLPGTDDQLQQQINEILQSVPAKIRLSAEPPAINLNPPDFKMPIARKPSRPDISRSQSNMSLRSNYSRSGTPSFTLAPAYGRTSRPRHQRGNQEIKLYHLSRSNGEAPIKLFIRCVGEHGERVMVRVGGGWADLGEYLKEYATHHLRRSGGAVPTDTGKVLSLIHI